MRRLLFLVLAGGLFANVAAAVPVRWTLQGVTFADGGTASGSFVYDADTNTYSAISVTTTAGTALTMPATYGFVDPGFPSTSNTMVTVVTATGDLTGVRVLELNFAASLTNSGGIVALVAGPSEGTCANSTCSSGTGPRSLSAGDLDGQLVTAPVPALSTWAMLGTVLLLCASAFLMLRKDLA